MGNLESPSVVVFGRIHGVTREQQFAQHIPTSGCVDLVFITEIAYSRAAMEAAWTVPLVQHAGTHYLFAILAELPTTPGTLRYNIAS